MVVYNLKLTKNGYLLIATSFILCIVGIAMIYSACIDSGSIRKPIVQLLAFLLGLILMLVFYRINYRTYRHFKNHIYIISLVLLVFVLIFGSGKEETGANSWIRFAGVGVQPSEFVKISFCLFISSYISDLKEKGKLNEPKEILKLLACFLSVVGLVILQNDTGTALVFTFMFASMLFISGISIRYILVSVGALIVSAPLAWFFMAPYQRDRILVFLNPEKDPLGAGFQVVQSKISIGSGRLFGRGYLNGPQNRLSLLPENETDFIFSTIGEEFGFLGCLIVLTLLLLFVFNIFIISKKCKDTEGQLISSGLGSMFLFHIVENISMCLGLLPVTGIPLPFLSYGGSSLVTNFIALGIVLNVNKVSEELCFNKYD